MLKYLIIGDIHGQYDKLKQIMNQVEVSDYKNIIFVGDYIDRGPKSKEVINYLIDLKHNNKDKIILLEGNHEDMVLQVLENGLMTRYIAWWMSNGGINTLNSYGEEKSDEEVMEAFLEDYARLAPLMDLYFEADNFIVTHSGYAEIDMKEADREKIL